MQVTVLSLPLALGVLFSRLIVTLPGALNSFIILLSLKLEAVVWLLMIWTLNVITGSGVLLGTLLVVPLAIKPYRPWRCAATLNIHVSGWLIFKFNNEEDKLNVLSGALILFMGGLSYSDQCQHFLISLPQTCTLFQSGLSFLIFLLSAGPLNVYLRFLVSLVSPFKVICLPLHCLDSPMLGC